MENNTGTEPTNQPDGSGQNQETVTLTKTEVEDLRNKADVSSQNFERLKKAEEELEKYKTGDLKTGDATTATAPNENLIEQKVDLRLAGHSKEEISFMEQFAKGANKRLSEVAELPFVKKAIEGMRAEQKSIDGTPPPSNRIRTFNGKPMTEVFKTGTEAEKQAAWEARVRGGVSNNE